METMNPCDPRTYGVAPTAVVAVRIEGKLHETSSEDAIEKLGYEVEYFHPECAEKGARLFESVSDRDDNVLAFELNWEDPCECPVCEVSIT